MAEELKNNENTVKEVKEKECVITRIGKWVDNKVNHRKPIPKGWKIAGAILGTLGAGACAYLGYTHFTSAADAETLSEAAETVKELTENASEELPSIE